MRIATKMKLNQDLELKMATSLKKITENHLSTVKGSEWHCECILEALALGNMKLAVKGVQNYLGGLGNQLPLHSRELLVDLVMAAKSGEAARVLSACKHLTDYHQSLGLDKSNQSAIANANLSVGNSHPPTDNGPGILILE